MRFASTSFLFTVIAAVSVFAFAAPVAEAGANSLAPRQAQVAVAAAAIIISAIIGASTAPSGDQSYGADVNNNGGYAPYSRRDPGSDNNGSDNDMATLLHTAYMTAVNDGITNGDEEAAIVVSAVLAALASTDNYLHGNAIGTAGRGGRN